MIAPLPRRLLAALLLLVAAVRMPAHEGGLGLFTDHTDIGAPQRTGTVAYDAAKGTYAVGGGGANMWFAKDSFHFVWKKVEGDVALAASLAFENLRGDPHKKNVLMIRQSLDHDSAYVDVAVHADGLTSLQFREAAGEVTREVQSLARAPDRVRLDKIGDYVYLSQVGVDGRVRPTGCSARVAFKAPFYVGLGVCAHNDAALEKVVFSNVVVGPPSPEAATVRSSIEYAKVASGDRVCAYPFGGLIESLDWTADDKWLFTVEGDVVVTIPAPPGEVAPPAASGAGAGVSPDGKWIARMKHESGDAVLTVQPVAGGAVRELMRLPDQADAPPEIAWSPDGTKIAYVRHQPGPN